MNNKELLEKTLQEILLDKSTNLLPENLKEGIDCLGITGTLTRGLDLDAIDLETLTNKIIESNNTLSLETSFDIAQYLNSIKLKASNKDIANAINLTSNKIVEGNTILGIKGTAELNIPPQEGNLKIYDSKIIMDADEQTEVDVIGVVYGKKTITEDINKDTFFNEITPKLESFSADLVANLPNSFSNQYCPNECSFYFYKNSNGGMSITIKVADTSTTYEHASSTVFYEFDEATNTYTYNKDHWNNQNSNPLPIVTSLNNESNYTNYNIPEEYISILSEIINFVKPNFEGLYKTVEKQISDDSKVILTHVDYYEANGQFTNINEDFTLLKQVCPDFYDYGSFDYESEEGFRANYKSIIKTNEFIYVYYGCNLFVLLSEEDKSEHLADARFVNSSFDSSTVTTIVKKYNLDGTFVEEYEIGPRSEDTILAISNYNDKYYELTEFDNSANTTMYTMSQGSVHIMSKNNVNSGMWGVSTEYIVNIYPWKLLPTQFSLANSDQLLEGYTAYGSTGEIIGTRSVVGSPAYYNSSSYSGINYVLQYQANKILNDGNFTVTNFGGSINGSGTQYQMPSLCIIPHSDLELVSMDIHIGLVDKLGNELWSHDYLEQNINMPNFYLGPCWSANNVQLALNERPSFNACMNAWDYNIVISNVQVVTYPTIEKSTSDFNTTTFDSIPFNINLIDGATFDDEVGIVHMPLKGYIESIERFDNKTPYTLEMEIQTITPKVRGNIMSVGGSKGYTLQYGFDAATNIMVRYGDWNRPIEKSLSLADKTLVTMLITEENIKVYFNNVLQFTKDNVRSQSIAENSKLYINYGPEYINDEESNLHASKMNMDIYSIRYYDKLLTEDEMRIHYEVFSTGESFTPTECTELTITADDVIGNKTTTTIHATAVCNGIDNVTGESVTAKTITFDIQSEPFEQNTTSETIEKEISYTYLEQTATTKFNHLAWIDRSITANLNEQWRVAETVISTETDNYDIYESNSNYNIDNGEAIMMLNVMGYSEFTLYFYNSSEGGDWDPIIAKVDSEPTRQDFDFKLQGSNTAITELTVEMCTAYTFTFEDEEEHTIYIKHSKDSIANGGNDRGYVMVPKT